MSERPTEYSAGDYRKLARRAKQNGATGSFLMQLRVSNLPEPTAEFVFHSTRKWRLDFAWPEQKIAVEIHGAVYANGRHTRGNGFTEDRRKMNAALALGWRVFEATTEMIESGEMIALLCEVFPGEYEPVVPVKAQKRGQKRSNAWYVERIMDFLQTYQQERGYGPSLREIGQEIGVSSTSQISYYLNRLEAAGLIIRDSKVARSIRARED